jgi:rhodanese-related sulfurtransferase
MKRRAFLAGTGLSLAGLAGCLGGGVGDPNASPGVPRTIERDGEQIQLMPVDTIYEWHRANGAKFVDARGTDQYAASHITGAVSSPAGLDDPADPVYEWATDQRIVCYCGCPHHLSSIRAAEFQKRGYTNVFVIDEGFEAWVERGYPVTGSAEQGKLYEIRGRTSPEFANEMVWVRSLDSDQLEAAPVQADGSYTVHVRFSGLTESSRLLVEAPGYSVEGTVASLTEQVVTAESVRSIEQ